MSERGRGTGRGRPKIIPVIGARYGKRVILREVERINIHTRVEVQCDCGHIGRMAFHKLRRGLSRNCQSCGVDQALTPEERQRRLYNKENREALAAIRREAAAARRVNNQKRKDERRQRVLDLLTTGLNKSQVAEALGVDRSLITLILQGKR